MKAGQTDINVGTKVIITGADGEDADMNGLTGKATHPFAFGCTRKDWIGIWLDKHNNPYLKENCNVHISEIQM